MCDVIIFYTKVLVNNKLTERVLGRLAKNHEDPYMVAWSLAITLCVLYIISIVLYIVGIDLKF